MKQQELRKKIEEYLDTVDNVRDNEWYDTDRGVYEYALDQFCNWLFKDDIERDIRRAQYLELKKEFEPE